MIIVINLLGLLTASRSTFRYIAGAGLLACNLRVCRFS